jgi:hypothetical protein
MKGDGAWRYMRAKVNGASNESSSQIDGHRPHPFVLKFPSGVTSIQPQIG